MNDRQIADWLLDTLRMFDVGERDAHQIIAKFFEALDTED